MSWYNEGGEIQKKVITFERGGEEPDTRKKYTKIADHTQEEWKAAIDKGLEGQRKKNFNKNMKSRVKKKPPRKLPPI